MIFYHGTSRQHWKEIQTEGILFGRRYILDSVTREPIQEVSRCTYLAVDKEEAEQYGEVVLQVEYNPYDDCGKIRHDRHNPLNNYCEGCWQVRVYEPIYLNNIKRIK